MQSSFFPIFFPPLQLQCLPFFHSPLCPPPPPPPPKFITLYNHLGHLSPILYPSLLSHLSPSPFTPPPPFFFCTSSLFAYVYFFLISTQYPLTHHHQTLVQPLFLPPLTIKCLSEIVALTYITSIYTDS